MSASERAQGSARSASASASAWCASRPTIASACAVASMRSSERNPTSAKPRASAALTWRATLGAREGDVRLVEKRQ